MGLLDSLLSGAFGGGTAGATGTQQSPMMMMALQLLQQNGGIQGVLAKFQQAGMGEHAQSWVSTGQNMPITGDMLQKVLGSGQLGQIAHSLGVDSGAAAGGLASMLPQVIDQMTPNGSIPEDHNDLVAKAMAILSAKKPA